MTVILTRLLPALACLTVFVAAAPASALQYGKKVETFKSWDVLKHGNGSKAVCYVASQPVKSRPTRVRGRKVVRGDIFFYVAKWADDPKAFEVSVRIGYPYRDKSTATVRIGDARFKLITKGEEAFLDGNETKVVEAMRSGRTMVVTGVSTRGTRTTDEYSLLGVTAALKRMDEECG